jgi:sec-independent protein translocase protein TatC
MWKFILNKAFKARNKIAVDLGSEDSEKPFIEHLEDLRTMIVRMAMTLLISTTATFCFYDKLFELIKEPLWTSGIVKTQAELQAMLQVLSPTEGIMMTMNIALIAAVILSFPFLLLFLLQFILPGLKSNEKKLVFPIIGIGLGLFLTGVCFSFLLVLPKALNFFAAFNSALGLQNVWRVNEYVTFATRFVLVFGVSFELPVLVMALVKLDILNYRLMQSTRPHAIVGIAIFAAIITPTTDPLTMLLMAGPLYVLYEICIWLAYFMEKKDREAYPEYYKELEEDEKSMAAPAATDEWDNEEYNPWSTSDDNKNDDDESARNRKADTPPVASTTPPPPAHGETPAPHEEKSLEESSRDDEDRTGHGPNLD